MVFWWLLMFGAFGVGTLLWWAYLGGRAARSKRFARRNGYRYDASPRSLLGLWTDLGYLHRGKNSRAVNVVEGERSGRKFALFDCRYDVEAPGPQSRAHMSPLLTMDQWPLFAMFDRETTQSFSAVVVEFELPERARTAGASRGFAPLRVEFGRSASLVCRDDGFSSPADLIAAVDKLNAALDEIVRRTTSSGSTA